MSLSPTFGMQGEELNSKHQCEQCCNGDRNSTCCAAPPKPLFKLRLQAFEQPSKARCSQRELQTAQP